MQAFEVVLKWSSLQINLFAVWWQAVPGEESNMILVHCWLEEEPEDMHLKYVVDILLATYKDQPKDADVRLSSQEVSAALRATVAANVAQHASGGQSVQTAAEDMDAQDAVIQLEGAHDGDDLLQLAHGHLSKAAEHAKELALAA